MTENRLSRRDVVQLFAAAIATPYLAGCVDRTGPGINSATGRLSSRPGTRTLEREPGEYEYRLIGNTTASVYIPPGVDRDAPTPLLVYLHGAGREVSTMLAAHKPWLDAAGVIWLAPFAVGGGSWAGVYSSGFGEDPAAIDEALALLFERWTIDPARIHLAGFSDGATESLGLGRANGELFTRVIAYAPGGLMVLPQLFGTPPILITHGTTDAVLSYDKTANLIVPALESAGYDVDFRSFVGGHGVPEEVAEEVVVTLGS